MAFLDEEQGSPVAEAPVRERRRAGPERRRQQYLVRRLIAVGVGLVFLILFVLGIRGCLDARKERGIRNYTRDVGAVVSESEQVGKSFFELLQSPGDKTDLQYQQEIRALRGQSESLLDRAERIDVPDELSEAQEAITLSLRLRRDGLGTIADNVTAALGEAERAEAIETITNQMGSLFSSDVLYAQLAVPEIERVLGEEEITVDQPLPAGNFMPEESGEEWLSQSRVVEALALVSGQEIAGGLHGTGLLQTAIGDTVLSADAPTTVPDDSREIAVQVQNQGESEESGVRVIVTVDGEELEGTIETIAAGETQTVQLPLTDLPQPGTETTLDVLVEPVPGEQVSDNNEASYSVTFG